MTATILCDNTEPHMFHESRMTTQYHCSGMTDCGQIIHEPHFVTVQNTRVWCPGICDCGMGGQHGPGEHK
jgi:hypothetical protein